MNRVCPICQKEYEADINRLKHGRNTPRDFSRLKNRLLGRCGYCKVNQANTIDHIIPLLRGGSNYIGNIMPACGACNYSKQHKTLVEWRNGAISCTRGARKRYAL